MQDNIPDALIAAFERHYDCSWNTPSLRNERLAWRAAWAEATKPCLHQITEPQAAPATVAVQLDTNGIAPCPLCGSESKLVKSGEGGGHRILCWNDACECSSGYFPSKEEAITSWNYRAALAATPAAAIGNPISKQNQQVAEPMVLPEPVATIYTMEALAPGGAVKYHAQVHKALPSGTKLFAEPDVRGLLAQAATAAAPAHPAEGVHVNAVGSIYVTAGGDREFDDWRFQLPIGNNLLYTAPVPADALATATGLPAQADGYPALPKGTGVWEFTSDTYAFTDEDMRAYVDADRAHRAAPQAQANARDDSALLDAMERQRIAVVPEYEGPWDAEVYNGEGKPNHRGSGSTPREAIRAAIAAAKGE